MKPQKITAHSDNIQIKNYPDELKNMGFSKSLMPKFLSNHSSLTRDLEKPLNHISF